MSKRDELIRNIESKQSQRRAVAKKMRPDPLPGFNIGNDSIRSTMYQEYITEHGNLANEIYQLIELANLLPKNNSQEIEKKRGEIVSSIENKVGYLQDLYSKRKYAQSQSHQGGLNNQISDTQTEIEDLKLILSLL